jgi:class 3 adenylate cyclase
MPYFMDRHDFSDVTAEDVATAHLQDLALQDRFGVKFLSYWFDYDRQSTFCLVDAPSGEQAQAVHKAAHGMLAGQIVPVDRGAVEMFLGHIVDPAESGESLPAFRAIMFTDMEGSTAQTQRLGDAAAMNVLRHHDSITRAALGAHRGTEVKHTGDGIMASFEAVTDTLTCAIAVQRGIQTHNSEAASEDEQFHVRIGIGAGEPVTERGDLFGAAVQLAARLCDSASPGHICLTESVRDLAIGKRFPFGPVEQLDLKGFEDPVRVVSLNWQDADEA